MHRLTVSIYNRTKYLGACRIPRAQPLSKCGSPYNFQMDALTKPGKELGTMITRNQVQSAQERAAQMLAQAGISHHA